MIRKYLYIKRLQEMIDAKSWEALMCEETARQTKIDPSIIKKQYWRLVKLMNRKNREL